MNKFEEIKEEHKKTWSEKLNALDGEGNLFQWDITYHFWDENSREVKSFVPRYGCMALEPNRFNHDYIVYCHRKTNNDVEFRVDTVKLYKEPKTPLMFGLQLVIKEHYNNIEGMKNKLSKLEENVKIFEEQLNENTRKNNLC